MGRKKGWWSSSNTTRLKGQNKEVVTESQRDGEMKLMSFTPQGNFL